MANAEHVALLQKGVRDWNVWRERNNPLIRPDFSGAAFPEAALSEANLRGADLRGTDLSRANLTGALLHGADLSRANLTAADLTKAVLRQADLSRADLSGALLEGADLRETKYLTLEQLQRVATDDATSLPVDFVALRRGDNRPPSLTELVPAHPLRCPTCGQVGQQVREEADGQVFTSTYSTAASLPASRSFVDEHGERHWHDPGSSHGQVICTEGHTWKACFYHKCRCGWPDTPTATAAQGAR
jgi:hypothetical protein